MQWWGGGKGVGAGVGRQRDLKEGQVVRKSPKPIFGMDLRDLS